MTKVVLSIILVQSFFMVGRLQHTELADLKKLYNHEQVDRLEKVLRELKTTPAPAHIPTLLEALNSHVSWMSKVTIGPDSEANLLAGIELYGEAVEVLQEAVQFYFETFGREPETVPSYLLMQVLEDFLVRTDSPFTYRGLASEIASRGQTVYLLVPRTEDIEQIVNRLNTLTKFRVAVISPTDLNMLLNRENRVPVLDVTRLLEYDNLYLIHDFLSIREKEGPPNLANISIDVIYGRTDHGYAAVNWVFFGH